MDLNDIWQENKRFITTVGSGLLVFLIVIILMNSWGVDQCMIPWCRYVLACNYSL